MTLRVRRPAARTVAATVLLTTGMGLMLASVHVERQASADRGRSLVEVEVAAEQAGPPGPSDPAALALLREVESATRSTAYDGVKVVQRVGPDGTVHDSTVLDVANHPELGTVVHAAGADGATTAQVFTPYVGVSAGHPASSASVLAGPPPGAEDGGVVTLRALERSYRLVDAGEVNVSGRSARAVHAYRPDGTLAARMSIDERTGLLLRRELCDAAGSIVETSAFVRLRVGEPDMDHVPPIARAPWEPVSGDELDRMRSAGWQVPDRLGAGLELTGVRRDDSGGSPVLHLGYTDGLVTLSVFQQVGTLDESALGDYEPGVVDGRRVWVQQHRDRRTLLVWQSDRLVVTAASDAPVAPLGAVLEQWPAPRAGGGDGISGRLERGVQRLGEWLNPLD